jgi:hypothetical protein
MWFALPVAADVGTFTLGDRTEIRARAPDPVTNAAALDVDTMVDARLEYRSPRTTYTLGYTPHLYALDVNDVGIQPSLIHGWNGQGEWRTGNAIVDLSENGSYGQLAFGSLAAVATPGTPEPTQPGGQPNPVPNVQPVAPVQTLDILASTTTATSILQLRPWTLRGMVGYQLFGGADAASRTVLPSGQGPLAQAQADVQTDARDHLVTLLDAQVVSFDPTGSQIMLLQAWEQWRYRLTRSSDTMLGVGAGETRARDASLAPYAYSTDPLAEGQYNYRFGPTDARVKLTLDARLAPLINQLTGLVDERVQATGEGSLTHRLWTYRASVTGAESTDQSSSDAVQMLMGEVDALYQVTPALSFDVGARAVAENQRFPTISQKGAITAETSGSFDQYVVFFAVTFRALRERF